MRFHSPLILFHVDLILFCASFIFTFFVLGASIAAQVHKGRVQQMAVYVVVGVDGLGGEIVVVKVRVRVAIYVWRKKYARIRVGYAQARVLGLVYFHLEYFEFVGQFLARFRAIVLDEQVEVALLVFGQVVRFAYLAKTL